MGIFYLLFLAVPPGAQAPAPESRVECRLPSDEAARVWRLERRPGATPEWWLVLSSPALGARRPALPLAGAVVSETPAGLEASSQSANGGVAVDLAAGAQSRLDVFVNYELEVNVWRDLVPEVERMNTGGPRTDAVCRVLAPGAGLP
ncbi:MAG: hypothetical protein AB7H88_13950 [Vicinamibacterales bacterium]